MNRKNIFLILIIAIILVGGGLIYYSTVKKPLKQIACTMEAKLCADGSAVGRSGPNCEFAACPVVTDETATWKIYTSADSEKGYEFKYPETFGANVWSSVFWPPKSAIIPSSEDPVKLGCPDLEAVDANGTMPKSQTVSLNNLDFSYYTSAGAGAGSLYSTYCYVTEKDKNYYTLEFSIRSHTGCFQGQCGAYCGTPNEAECRKFDLARDVVKPIQKIVSTFKFVVSANK